MQRPPQQQTPFDLIAPEPAPPSAESTPPRKAPAPIASPPSPVPPAQSPASVIAKSRPPAPHAPAPYASSDQQSARPGKSSIVTIPLLCAGIAILACCLLIPAADENRRLTWERERLRIDLAQIEKQAAVNDTFLHRLVTDPALSERLARRQMKMVREGTSVLEIKQNSGKAELSPFLLVTLPPPAPLAAYQPTGGVLGGVFRHPKSQLYLTGTALLMMAVGLVMGGSSNTAE